VGWAEGQAQEGVGFSGRNQRVGAFRWVEKGRVGARWVDTGPGGRGIGRVELKNVG
jgi:hypothetical protein